MNESQLLMTHGDFSRLMNGLPAPNLRSGTIAEILVQNRRFQINSQKGRKIIDAKIAVFVLGCNGVGLPRGCASTSSKWL
jgi:hypothetical protein